ncbi:MAG: hypothetical protein WCX69_04150 [Candidatus Paceibacterota bacterium]
MISFKIDKLLKSDAQKTARALGVSLNAVVNQYIKEFVANRQVVFTDHPVPNKKTRRLLDRASADIKAGKNLYGPFYSAEEMIKSLKGDK